MISTFFDPAFGIGAVLAALGLALALWVPDHNLPKWQGTFRRGSGTASTEDTAVSMLFRNGALVDATPSAARLLGPSGRIERLVDVMKQRFPGADDLVNERATAEILPSALPDDAAYLSLSRKGEHLVVNLHDTHASAGDRHLLLSGSEDTDRLRDMMDHAPIIIWAADADGQLVHANAAFYALAKLTGKPMPFDLPSDGAAPRNRRLWIEDPDTQTRHWYDLSTYDTPEGWCIYYAANADAVATAEIAQRNFVQTLTKTFAQLSIGLAIFDRHRQLALFNPALLDLTSLPADFLSARPTLSAFFDQLRDRQIMPEPRNYRTWRGQLSDMISAARDGAYCETWTLPTGLTYRVSGKPHPDGAVAFLFEDISAEITLTRRFRSELEQSQAVIDAIDSAIAVFSRSGVLTFANESFRNLWKCSPDESFIELTILDVSRIWQDSCAPTPVWGELRDFVRSVDERVDWQDEVHHKTEGRLSVVAAPVSGGATLVRFDEKELAPLPARQ